MRTDSIFTATVLQGLTLSVLNGNAEQFFVDPALGAEWNIHMKLPHQVIYNRIGTEVVSVSVEYN